MYADKHPTTIFWGQSPAILFQRKRMTEFFPKKYMTPNQQLNAVSRLIIYLALALSLYKGNSIYILYGIVGLLCIWLWHKFGLNSVEKKEGMSDNIPSVNRPPKKTYKVKYVAPTKSNPFMNPLPGDKPRKHLSESKLRDENTDYDKVQSDITDKFNQGLFKEISDIYGRENSQRQFYTLPNTSQASDQDNFAKWLYDTPPTCKEGNGMACVQNNHTPLQGNLFASI